MSLLTASFTANVASYLVCDIALLIMIIPIRRRLTFTIGTEAELKAYKQLLYSIALYIITDAVLCCFLNDLVRFNGIILSVSAAVNEVSLALIDVTWLLFGEAHLGYDDLDHKWKRILLMVPAALQIFLAVASCFTGWFFQVAPSFTYARGPWFMLMPAIEAFYMLYVSWLALKRSRAAKNVTKRDSANSLLLFIIAPACASVVQLFIPSTPIVCIALFISIYLVFISLLAIQINHDALTRLNNRRRSENYMADRISSASPQNPIWLFLADVDYFKKINDTYGHVEGDHALCIVADSIRQAADHYSGFAARIGGDEFVLSVNGSGLFDPKDVSEYLEKILTEQCKKENTPYQLTLSVGWAKCIQTNETMEELIAQADHMQYENKQARHAQDEQ
jgi:diguanylate cyclase (GGDEF)-like protein